MLLARRDPRLARHQAYEPSFIMWNPVRIALLILLMGLPHESRAEIQTRPNIVLIYADDLGYADLACYGNEYFETPNIDALMAKGIRFTSAYSNAPLCAPSRIALLSGRYSARVGCYEVTPGVYDKTVNVDEIDFQMPVNQLRLPQDRKILPELLKEAGYFTGFIGKWHVGAERPTERGFDEFVEVTNVNSGGSHNDVGTAFRGKTKGYPEAKGDSGDYLTQCAKTFLDHAGLRNGPFFLYLAHTLVHIPVESKRELIDKYKAKEPSPYHHHPIYAAMVDNLDANVGKLMDELREKHLLDNTLVIFTSDNGGATGMMSARPGSDGYKVGTRTSNYPLRGGKCQLFEGGIRVPMGIVLGDRLTPAEFFEPVTQMDLLPTIVEFARVEGAEGLDGRSLKPILQDVTSPWPERSLFWHYPGYRSVIAYERAPQGMEPGSRQRPASAVRRGDWKLIESLETGETQLYNLSDDLGETIDLATDNTERVASLKAELESWRDEVNAPMIIPKPRFATARSSVTRSAKRTTPFIDRVIGELKLSEAQAEWFAADQAKSMQIARELQQLPLSQYQARIAEHRRERRIRLKAKFTPEQFAKYQGLAKAAFAKSAPTSEAGRGDHQP